MSKIPHKRLFLWSLYFVYMAHGFLLPSSWYHPEVIESVLHHGDLKGNWLKIVHEFLVCFRNGRVSPAIEVEIESGHLGFANGVRIAEQQGQLHSDS